MLFLAGASLLPTAALAADSQVSEEAYGRAIDLVDRLYLYPDELDAAKLLHHAALGLADQIHWLIVEAEADAVYLAHGDGTPIGSVSVATLSTLPDALRALESVVVDAGYDIGDVDVRLEILKGMTTGLDRYSRVLAGDKLERFDVRLKGTLVGIGATLEIRKDQLVITELTPGGPAEQGGILIGDVVVRIDGISTVNMPVKEATSRVRGDVDSPIVITIQRGERDVRDIALVRAEVVVPNVMHEVLADNVAYIKIDHFSQRTVDNLLAAVDDLRNNGALSRGLILDLRHNTGGSMKEAARSADQFLTEGMLLRTAGPDGERVQNLQARMDAVNGGTEPQIPIIVLIDEQTASGSEILAGALFELDRAVLIGYPSYGKGTVQKIYNLDEEARLKLTVAQYLLEHDRAIADGGLVPDTVLGTVEIDHLGVRYRGWEESRAKVPWEEIVPVLTERDGPGQRWKPDPDAVAVELARRAIVRAKGPSRAAVLAAVDEVVPLLRAEQDSKLVRALEVRGIDWTPAPPADDRDLLDPPRAAVRLVTDIDPAQPDIVQVAVEVEVENLGTAPLHRVLVELECDSFEPWSGLVIPVGRVAPGGRQHGRVAVSISPGIDSREDVVRVKLRADQHSPLGLDDEVLRAGSTPVPRLAVAARLVPEGDHHRAEITVRNLSSVEIRALEASFAWPSGLDVELLDTDAWVDVLAPRAEAHLDLPLRIGETTSDIVPLVLELHAQRFDDLAEWPLDLPVDGGSVSVEAPRITLRSPELSAPIGPHAINLQVADEHAIDHVVIYANRSKVLWAGGGKDKLDLRADVTLKPGANRIHVLVEDDQGLVTRRMYVIRGETSSASVDAGDHDTDPG